jgi:hypothetical protein
MDAERGSAAVPVIVIGSTTSGPPNSCYSLAVRAEFITGIPNFGCREIYQPFCGIIRSADQNRTSFEITTPHAETTTTMFRNVNAPALEGGLLATYLV